MAKKDGTIFYEKSMTPPSISASPHRLRYIIIVALILFSADLAVTLNEQISDPNAKTPLLHLVITASFLVILGYSARRFPISGVSENDTDPLCLPHLPLPAILVDRQGKICGINSAAAQSVHRAPSALINQPVHELFHPPNLKGEQCVLCRHIKAGQTFEETDFAVSARQWQRISLSAVSTQKTDRLLELHIDISKRKQAERQMALAIDGAQLGYWDWDYVTGKHQVNQRWLDMLGLTADDLDHYVSDWDHRIHPDDQDRVRGIIAKHIASNKPYVVEFRMQHKNGHWVWIRGSGAVVERDPATGKPTRLCGTHQDVTTRKNFEQNLEAAYQVISQSSSVVFKWNNADGLPIEFATENVRHLLGYSLAELMRGNVFYLNLIHPEDQPAFTEELNGCLKPDCMEITHLPYRIISRSGSVKWVQDHKVINRNDQGKITGYQGLVTDITRLRQQSSAIRNIVSSAQEKHSPATLDNLALLTAETLNADYVLIGELRSNQNLRVLSFCSTTQTGDITVYPLHPRLQKLLATGAPLSHPDGASSLFSDDAWLTQHGIEGLIGIPLQNGRQQILGFLVAMYRQPIPDPQFAEDIVKLFAAQISTELERASAMKALEIQKQRLVDAQSISHIGDWQWHWSDNRFSWSDEMYRISATSRANFIPSFASILTQLVHPDDRNLFKTSLQNANGKDTIDFKHRIVLGDGSIRHVHQRGKVIYDDRHRAIGIQGTMQDITERLQTEQRLLEAKQEAERATRVKSEFLANMSHEIRTPMNAIVGLIELCLNSPISSKQRDYLERAETATHNLMALIDDILDFSKMESGKLSLQNIPFSLAEVLDQVFSTMTELCNRKHLRLIRPTLELPLQTLIGDPQRLRQVLINLIGNAIKFTQQGEIEVRVKELKRTSNQTTLEFSISDTGIGMSKEQLNKLFRPFTQGDGSVSRHYGGTGLGLVISKQLVEQMGGAIDVTSEEHIGSCFSFTVKLGMSDLPSSQNTAARPPKNIDNSRLPYFHEARALLVEDNEVNRIVATELLSQVALQVDTAENGEIALSKLKQNRYDCVLMDVQMPVMDGYQTTRKIRQMPHCSEIPVIAMTANVMNDDRKKCLQAGMNDFISKPILPETLYNTLIRWIKPTPMTNITNSASDDIPYLYGIDSSIGLLHTAEDKSVFRKVLYKFADNHSNSMKEIERAVSENNLADAKLLAHTLKGLAGSLGAIQLQGHLIRLEELLGGSSFDAKYAEQLNKLIGICSLELSRIINGIQRSLPLQNDKTFRPKHVFSAEETRQQLEILRNKLQAFDSDADRQMELILSNLNPSALTQELNKIKKQIANYQFVDATQALTEILDAQTNKT